MLFRSKVNEKINDICAKFSLKGKVLPIKSVGVQGDARTYRHPCVVIGEADWKILEKVSTELTNNVKEINRVIWLVKGEVSNPALKKSYLTKERVDLVREADFIAMNEVSERHLMDEIWQMPTVLMPMGFSSGESVVLRPVYSKEAMTAKFAELPVDAVLAIAEKILALEGIDAVFYDITHKPPGTIEWE